MLAITNNRPLPDLITQGWFEPRRNDISAGQRTVYDQAPRYVRLFPDSAASHSTGKFRKLARSLESIGSLPPNWDGYGALPIDPSSLLAALAFLSDLRVGIDTALPAVVPVNNGRVQLEWHRRGCDLEIEFVDSGACDVYFLDTETGEEHSQKLPIGATELHALIERVI